MARTSRTFIAVPLADSSIKRIGRLQSHIADLVPGARWIEPHQLHLTLAFLGDIPEVELHGVCKAVAEAVKPHWTFSLDIVGLGVFPDLARPRVLWAGLQGDLEPLLSLRQAVADASRRAGYPPEDDRFSPHITIARMKPGRGPSVDLTAVLNRNKGWSGSSLDVSSVITYASSLTADGPVYDPLGTARLRPGSRTRPSPPTG